MFIKKIWFFNVFSFLNYSANWNLWITKWYNHSELLTHYLINWWLSLLTNHIIFARTKWKHCNNSWVNVEKNWSVCVDKETEIDIVTSNFNFFKSMFIPSMNCRICNIICCFCTTVIHNEEWLWLTNTKSSSVFCTSRQNKCEQFT